MLVGGGSRSAFWAQLISDITGLTLNLPVGAELGSAFGAARLAMLAAGGSEAEICTKPPMRRSFAANESNGALLAQRRKRMQSLYRGNPQAASG
jgi:xylulokinase